MRFRERDQSSIRSYQRISLAKRKRLVQMITNEGYSLSRVAKKLKLKLTTARLILKKFKETGTFPMRNFKKKYVKSDRMCDSGTVKEQQVEEEGVQSAEEKLGQEEGIKMEEPPLVGYYFVNEMPNLSYFSPFWASSMHPWS